MADRKFFIRYTRILWYSTKLLVCRLPGRSKRWRHKNLAWRLPESDQSPKAVCRRPPVCVGSTDLLVSEPPGGNGSTRRLVWRSPGGAGSAKTVVWWPPGSVGPRKPVVWSLPGRSGTTWKGSNTTPAVVSKCPGDRTGSNNAHRDSRGWTFKTAILH